MLTINADNLNSNFLQLGRRSGGQPQRTVHLMRLTVNTDHYIAIVQLGLDSIIIIIVTRSV